MKAKTDLPEFLKGSKEEKEFDAAWAQDLQNPINAETAIEWGDSFYEQSKAKKKKPFAHINASMLNSLTESINARSNRTWKRDFMTQTDTETQQVEPNSETRKAYRTCDKFKNKRVMSWLAFIFVLVSGVSAYFVEVKSPEVLNTCIWVCASMVLVYFGASTIADHRMLGARDPKRDKNDL